MNLSDAQLAELDDIGEHAEHFNEVKAAVSRYGEPSTH